MLRRISKILGGKIFTIYSDNKRDNGWKAHQLDKRSSFYFCQFFIVICLNQASNRDLLYQNSCIQLPLKYIYCWWLAASLWNTALSASFLYYLVRKKPSFNFVLQVFWHTKEGLLYFAVQRLGESLAKHLASEHLSVKCSIFSPWAGWCALKAQPSFLPISQIHGERRGRTVLEPTRGFASETL